MKAVTALDLSSKTDPKSIKKFMLNSAEHGICPASKSQITNTANTFLLNMAEHENFSANKYINAIY